MTRQPNSIILWTGSSLNCPIRSTAYPGRGLTFIQMLNHFKKLHEWTGRCIAYLEGKDVGDTALYYEAHITIEPVFDNNRDFAADIANQYNFKLAHLLMKKRSADTEERSDKDTFMTGHSKNLTDISERTKALVTHLKAEGFKVWRYKIEDTLVDSRTDDQWRLLDVTSS